MTELAQRVDKRRTFFEAAIALVVALLLFANVAIAASTLADGEYNVDVTLGGGTGRASVGTPSRVVVSGGEAVATIVWSSQNYDLMIVDGVEYAPVNDGGNSTFVIPVSQFDAPLSVSARTTAMSEPHLIDYTLFFDSSSAEDAFRGGAPNIPLVIGAFVVALILSLVMMRIRRRE